MAIYHFTTKIISRADGRSIVRAAAYRSASCLFDQRVGLRYSYEAKSGVIHTEVLTPAGAPDWMRDRERLWNHVEMFEKRIDAQLGREVEFALPRELSKADNIALAQDFVKREFVARGMVADLCIHWDIDSSGNPKPHAHVLLTLRGIQGDGFGPKRRNWQMTPDGKTFLLDANGKRLPDWNNKALLIEWRERWADHVNQRLRELGIDQQIDHRSFADRGIRIEPEQKIHGMTERILDEGLPDEADERNADSFGPSTARAIRAVARHARNIERLLADPSIVLDLITRTQSTFTDYDLSRALHRYTALAVGQDEFQVLLAKARHHPELVAIGHDGRGVARFSTRSMIETEEQMERTAHILANTQKHTVPEQQEPTLSHLGDDQRRALHHVLGGSDICAVIGFAGSGKTTLLAAVRETYERQGFNVKGAALAGIAAENLRQGAGIESRTIASQLKQWRDGRHPLTARDILIVDEAGMIGSRDMNELLHHVEKAGAKIVLVGDARQLQAISAGAAFRALVERTGAATLSTVRRQKDDWRKATTRKLAAGLIPEALGDLRRHDAIKAYADTNAAKEALLRAWSKDHPATSLLFAHSKADVGDLNARARALMRERGRLGSDQTIGLTRTTTDDEGQSSTSKVTRDFAAGDRILFTRNEQSLGVQNGSLGTLVQLEKGQFRVKLDTGQTVEFAAHMYGDIEHGYALTIHKTQGATVDRAYVLATNTFDQHLAYVALTRDRIGVRLCYGRDQFEQDGALDQVLSRERPKDSVLDYRGMYAERRGIATKTASDENAIPGATITPVPIKIDVLMRGPAPALKPPITVKLPEPTLTPRPSRPATAPMSPIQTAKPVQPAKEQTARAPEPAAPSYDQQLEAWKAARAAERQRRKGMVKRRDQERER